MINGLKASYPIATLRRILEVLRSSYYKAPMLKQGDQALLAAIEKVILKRPYYGYRRVTYELHRKGYEIGETRIRRLLKQIEHSCSVGKSSIPNASGQHDHPRYPNLIKKMKSDHLNQVWAADNAYIQLGRKFIYLAVILDAYSRGIRG